jgi:colanic acid/amylovoran biosynthesis protein
MQCLLVGNGSYLNRGCEAIVRGTIQILRTSFGAEAACHNAYYDYLGRNAMELPHVAGVVEQPLHFPRGIARRCREVGRKLLPASLFRNLVYAPLGAPLRSSDLVLSVGGDNFSLDYGLPVDHVEQNHFIHSHGKPLVIWGASIGPFDHARPDHADQLHRHLRDEVTAIFAREDETIDYLRRHGITDNVRAVCDPAFAMEPEPIADDALDFSLPEGAIGLNLSPLIAEKVATQVEEQYQWAAKVIDCLWETCRRPIVLIPHVTLPWSDDYRFMAIARDRSTAAEKVYLLPPTLNAAQTKFVIAHMDCLVAARTHAAIAAFSSGVPAVSLAYSMKASGLNRQVFGHTDYLLSGCQMPGEAIAELAEHQLAHRQQISMELQLREPFLRQQAFMAGQYLHELLS